MKIYKTFAFSALLLCSGLGAAYAQNYWCSSDGFGYLATMAAPETSCIATKGSPDAYKSCVENLRKNNEKTKADLQKGICKPIQEKQATYGQTKCKYFYIIENGKVEDRGNESFSLSKNSEFEKDKCLQIAKDDVSKTLPATSSARSSATSVKWADQNLSPSSSTPKPVSMTSPGQITPKTYTPTKTYSKPSYQYNFPPQYAPAQGYKNPSDAYKK